MSLDDVTVYVYIATNVALIALAMKTFREIAKRVNEELDRVVGKDETSEAKP